MAKLNVNDAYIYLATGAGVMLGTGLIAPIFNGIAFLGFNIPALNITLGTSLAAGVSAGVISAIIRKFYK